MTTSTVRLLSGEALADVSPLLDRIVPALVALEPPEFYDESSIADLRQASHSGLEAVLRSLAGRLPLQEALDVARTAGRRQVQQDLPLEGVLRAYRIASQVLWEEFVGATRARRDLDAEDLLDSASELWSVIDCFSAAASEGYRAEEAALRKRDDRVQASLLAALLDGRAAEPEFARDAARALGLGPDDRFACVVGLAPGPGVPALDSPKERLRAAGIASVWMSTAAGECGLVVLSSATPTTVRAVLLPAVRDRAGMSPPFTALTDLPRAKRLAEIAARAAGAGRVALLEDDLSAALAADSPLVADVVWQRTVGTLLATGGADAPVLLDTVRALIAADGMLNVAAAESFVHRNTMLYRLNKVDKLTGTNLRSLNDQVLWVVGLKEQQSRDRR